MSDNYLELLQKRQDLTEEQMTGVMTRFMSGEASTDYITLFLKLLSEKGEAVSEIIGGAKVMRSKALPVQSPYNTIDCCGTGGDRKGTLNISTAVALVAAGCGVPVAKHGNRAASSQSGAADVLEALGANLDIPQAALEEALEDFGFCFLMAPAHHKAMRYVAEARKKLAPQRTIFNLLGPLSNPAGAKLQLLGVYDRQWVRPLAETLKALGAKSAWVVHGADGLDEISICGPTYAAQLDREGKITETELNPDDFGLATYPEEALTGGSAEKNAAELRALLQGKRGAYRDIVLANAAATLVIHGSARSLKEGVAKAASAIDDGMALAVLTDYISFTRSIDDAA